MPLDMAAPTERFQVRQVEGRAVLVERLDVVGFQAASAATPGTAPAVALEYGPARVGPLAAVQRSVKSTSTSCHA